MAIVLPIIVFILVTLIICYGIFVYSRRNLYKYAAPIPGYPQLPFLGNSHLMVTKNGDVMKILLYLISNQGKDGVSKFWLGPKLLIILTHPPSIEIILNSALDKDSEYRFMKSFIGDGLVSAELNIWRKHRKILKPTFNQKVLNGYVDFFVDNSNILVKKLSAEIGKGQFDVLKYTSLYTLDTICQTAMGIKVNAHEDINHSYIKAGKEQMSLITKRMFQILLKPQWLFNLTSYAKAEKKNLEILHGFTDSIVHQKRLEYKNRENKQSDSKIKASLELMIELNEDGEKFSDREIREEVDSLVIGGNQTTAVSISNILVILGCLPHVQDKVIDELREIFGDSDRLVCKEDLPKMQYMERVIKETLRLFPVGSAIGRELNKDVKLENYTLPAGSGCWIIIWGVHRDKKIWGENAEEFDPDRFLPENSVNRHPYAYLPFSRGLRDCIGKNYAMMSLKISLCTVLRSYKIHSKVDYKNIEFKIQLTTTPVHGHLISIERRNKF